MDEQKLNKFLEWLPTKFQEFENKSVEEIAELLNNLYETDSGKQTIETLINTFFEEEKNNSKFKWGGKLDYLISLHKNGGKLKRCKCGCAMKKVMEKGGIVEKCACGCKSDKISKAQEGTKVVNQSGEILDKKHPEGNERRIKSKVPYPYKWFGWGEKKINSITRPNGSTFYQKINASDTTYVLPDGLTFNRQQLDLDPGFNPSTGISHKKMSEEEIITKANIYDEVFKRLFKNFK